MSEPLEFRLGATDAGVLATFNKVESGIKDVAVAFGKLADRTDEVATDFKQVDAAAKSTDKAMGEVVASSAKVAGGLAQVDAAATRAEKALKDTADSSKKAADHGAFLTGSLDKVKAGFVAVGTIVTGFVVGLAALTQQVTSNAVEVDRWGQRLGVSVDWMSRMQFAVAPLGLDMNSLGEALSNATEKLSEAAVGGNDSATMFARLGIAATDSAGNVREIDAVLPELATALQGMTNDADRVTMGLRLFGEEGSRMIPILLQGAEGLAAFQARADLFGTTLSGQLVADSKTFQAGLQGVIGALQGTANAIVEEVLPGVNALIPQITAFVIQLKESSLVTGTLIPLLGATTEALGGIANNLGTIETAWNAVNTGFNLVVAGFLDGIVLMLNGVNALRSASADAADWLKLPGVAASLRQAAAETAAVIRETEAMAKVARETADEWATRNVATADSFGKVVAKVKDAQAQTKSLDTQTKENKATVDTLVLAYQNLGLETAKALKDAADKGIAAFRTIVADQESNTQIIATAWEALQQKLIAAYGRIPPQFKVIDEAIKSGNTALIDANLAKWLEWIKAAEDRYAKVPDNLKPANARVIQGAQETGIGVTQAFDAMQMGVVKTGAALIAYFDGIDIAGRAKTQIDGFIIDIQGRAIPALTAAMTTSTGELTRLGRDALQVMKDNATGTIAAVGDAAALTTQKVAAAAKAAVAEMEAMRTFVTTQLGKPPDVAAITFGTTMAELSTQYGEILASFNGLAQRASTIGGNFLRDQQQVLFDAMAEIERRMAALQVKTTDLTGSLGTSQGGSPITYGPPPAGSGTPAALGGGSQFGGSGLVAGIDHTNYEAIRVAIAEGRAQLLGYVVATGESLYDFGDGLGRTIREFLEKGLALGGSGQSLGGSTLTYGPPPTGGTPIAASGTSGTYTSPGTPGGPIDYGYGLPGMARGGLVPGYGPPDSLVTRVSPGEFLIPPREVSELMKMLREALPARGDRRGTSTGRAVTQPTINIQIAYTGVQNPRQMVRDLREALQEEVRRGGLTLAAR